MLAKPESCKGCALYGNGMGFSNPEGTGCIGVLVMAEALGEDEERDAKPLRPYAQAGSMWERLLRLSRLDRQQLVHYNTVNCRPPKNFLENAPWEFEAISHCKVHRDRVINQYKPRVILTLGNIATRTMTGLAGNKQGITYLRGFWFDTPNGIVCPTVHPSFIQRGKKSFIPVAVNDITQAVNIAQLLARGQRPERKPVRYITNATLDEAWSFYYKCRDNSSLLIGYDIETPSSAIEDEDQRGTVMDEVPEVEEEIDELPVKRWPDDYSQATQETVITQIQFSTEPYTGIVFPWSDKYIEIALLILSLPNPKCGWNNWDFDDRKLRLNGAKINGPSEDFMWKWHHLQPDLPAGLQFAGSLLGMDYPWKHLALEGDMGEYGCADVDVLMRAAPILDRALKGRGVERGYERHIKRLAPILWSASADGIPVNGQKLADFEHKITPEQEKLADEKIRPKVTGLELGNIEPKDGFKTLRAPELKSLLDKGMTDPDIMAQRFKDKDGHSYRYMKREFVEPTKVDLLSDSLISGPPPQPIARWCRQFDFNPGSANQIKAYMRKKGHPVPLSWKEGKETTNKDELERLAKKVKDPFYTDILEYRKYDKMISTYCIGWRPKADGRVHTTWTFRPATGQLSSTDPNAQNAPKHVGLAEEFRDCIEAPPGHKIVEFDYKSFHVITLGFEARDHDYIRMGRLDIHSYLTAHTLKLPDRDILASLPDDELRERLAWIKKNHKHERDYKSKRALLGYGFGMGYRKLYQLYRESFSGEAEARRIHDVLNNLFPRACLWREQVKHNAQKEHRLLSRHGYHRLFHDVLLYWGMGKIEDAQRRGRKIPPKCRICCQVHDNGEQSEQAIAFLPANDAFGHIKDAMLRLGLNEEGLWDEDRYRQSWLGRSGFCNTIHDSLMFVMPDAIADQAIPEIYNEMTKPSEVLVDPEVAPTGLVCDVEVSVGQTWKKLEAVSVQTGMGMAS